MNVIISNKYKDLLNSLNYDIIKNINGEFAVDEIISSFSSFFFNRMFLDITAIKDYKNPQNLQKLSMNLDMSRIILLLDDDPYCTSPQFLSQIISLGIYNFTRNKEGLEYLYEHPNIYRDVAHLHNVSGANPQNNMGSSYSNNNYSNNSISMNFGSKRIIGIKNVTSHAGATTFTYMFYKALSGYYTTKAIEVDKRDFMHFRDENLVSLNYNDVANFIQNDNSDMFIIDLNSGGESLCTDVLYLIEPSTIKLSKTVMLDSRAFQRLQNKNVILNKCILTKGEISDFEVEIGINVLYHVPPLDERKDNTESFLPIIDKLGLIKRG